MRIVKLGLVIFLGAMVSPAFAQDQDAPNWNGLYVGGSLGQRSLTADWTTTALCALESTDPTCFEQFVPATASPSFNSSAVHLGAYLGYNWNLNTSWLIGVEADFGGGSNSKTVNYIPGTVDITDYINNPDNTTVSASGDASLRARAGYLITPDWLVYGTGGLALLETKTTEICYATGPWCGGGLPSYSETYSKTMVGWTGGIGMEKFFGQRWIARFEWSYADYGSFSHLFLADSYPDYDDNTATVSFKSSMVNLGIAYKF